MEIKIDAREEGNVNVLYFEGSLDASNSENFRDTLAGLSQKKGGGMFVLSMGGAEFISSAGWSALVESCVKIREAKGELKVADMRKTAARIFNLMGLDAFLKAYESCAEAVKSYAE